MKINRNNYESYLVDYLDGNLTPREIQETELFLLLNNDLNDLIEDWDKAILIRPNIRYNHKNVLKKDELQGCPDYYAIAAAENSLTITDIKILKKHPAYQKDINLYSKLKLKVNPDIQYTRKKKLYRPAVSKQFIIRYSAIAVVIGLFLMISSLFHYTPWRNQTSQITLSKIQKITLNYDIKLDNISPSIEIVPIPSLLTSHNQNIVEREKLEPIRSAKISTTTTLISFSPEITLIQDRPNISVLQPEIYLAESASVWKTSEKNFLSDNIFNSMITASKTLAEKLKNISKQE